jgi:hypothetical protein
MAEETSAPMDGGESTAQALDALLSAPEPEKKETPETKGASGQDAPPEPAPEGDEAPGPEEDQATGEEDEGESDQATVIAPPRSWPAEAREAFKALPPDLQKVIAERDAEQTTTFNRQVQEAAEKRKAADAELQAASNERRQYLANLSAVVSQLATQAAGEFADIKTPQDLERLATEDPQRFLRWQARRDALQAAQAEHAAVLEQQRAEDARRFNGYLGEERKHLLEKMPELGDPKKAKAIQAESTAYLKEIGFSDQEIGTVVDHRLALVVRDAVAWRKSQAAAKTAAAKKVVNVPKVTKPGAGSDVKAERSKQEKAAMTAIARHGTTDQQAAALSRLLEQGT